MCDLEQEKSHFLGDALSRSHNIVHPISFLLPPIDSAWSITPDEVVSNQFAWKKFSRFLPIFGHFWFKVTKNRDFGITISEAFLTWLRVFLGRIHDSESFGDEIFTFQRTVSSLPLFLFQGQRRILSDRYDYFQYPWYFVSDYNGAFVFSELCSVFAVGNAYE